MVDSSSALGLVLGGDPSLYAIVRLSLIVSLSATALAGLVALPLGAWLALVAFPGRTFVVVLLNALMGLPPVVVGLAMYLLLSRSGAGRHQDHLRRGQGRRQFHQLERAGGTADVAYPVDSGSSRCSVS